MNRSMLADAYIDEMTKHVAEKEDPNLPHHMTPWVVELNKRVGAPPGSAYCITGATCTLQDTCKRLGLKDVVGLHCGTQQFYRSSPEKYKSQVAKKGMIGIFVDRDDPDHGHAVVVSSDPTLPSAFNTIEFNTNSDGDREGNGVWRHNRLMSGTQGLKLLGFVDVCQWVLDDNI
jgi:hypothetical protein